MAVANLEEEVVFFLGREEAVRHGQERRGRRHCQSYGRPLVMGGTGCRRNLEGRLFSRLLWTAYLGAELPRGL